VFRGTFSLAAAEAVVGAVPPEPISGAGFEMLDLLSRLVDKSMVSIASEEPEVRYRLLETVREYASQKLTEAGEADEFCSRHRDFFLGLADDWSARTNYWDWWRWIPRINADHDNFVASLEWSSTTGDHDALLRLAAAHWPYWYWGEALGWRQWLTEAVDQCKVPSPARVEALIALASLLMRSGEDGERFQELFGEARDVAVGLANDQLVGQVNFYQAHAFLSLGELRRAESLLRDSFGRSKNTDFIGWCHWGLGWIALLEDHLDEAAREFQTSRELADATDDDSMRAHVGSALALVAALRGDHETGRTMSTEAIGSAERVVAAPRVLMMALAHGGQAAILSGVDSAATTVSRLLRILWDMGVTYWADEALAVAAVVLADQCPEDAAVILTSRPSLREALDDTGTVIGAIRTRLRQCRAQLIQTLGPDRWQEAEQEALALPAREAIARALTALETSFER